MKKAIDAGYAYPGQWKGKGSPIYPSWWIEDEDGEYAEDMAANPPEEVILPANKKYTLKIEYPLSTPFLADFETGKKGMTRQEFVDMACEAYQEIYRIEDGDVGGPTPDIPGMLNRQTSDGRYGIWGHDIGDLTIHTLYLEKNNLITLGVDS